MFKRVIVPLDGSPLAEGIMPFLLDIAGPLDLEIALVQVIAPLPPPIVDPVSPAVVIDDIAARTEDARTYLATIASGLRARGVRVTTDARVGDVVSVILAAAKTAGADLIAMTTHGRSGFGRVLFGSVAEAVLRRSSVPVFLMRLTEWDVAARRAA